MVDNAKTQHKEIIKSQKIYKEMNTAYLHEISHKLDEK